MSQDLKVITMTDKEIKLLFSEAVKPLLEEVSEVITNALNAPPQKVNRWATKKQLAEERDVSLQTIRNWERDGWIKGHRLPNSTRVYFDRDEIDRTLLSLGKTEHVGS